MTGSYIKPRIEMHNHKILIHTFSAVLMNFAIMVGSYEEEKMATLK